MRTITAGRGRLATAITVLMMTFIGQLAAIRPAPVEAAFPWYVSPTGSNVTGNGSRERPFRTIQRGANAVPISGTVFIDPGVYRESVVISSDAQESSPVVFTATGPGVVIEAADVERDAVLITDASYVVWSGIRIQNALRAGLRISSSHYITVAQ